MDYFLKSIPHTPDITDYMGQAHRQTMLITTKKDDLTFLAGQFTMPLEGL